MDSASYCDAGPTAARRPRRSTAIRSATDRTSVRLCEMTITAMSWLFSRLIRSSTTRVWVTPRAAVGSSRITSFAWRITARATATACRWPPDSDPTGWRTERTVTTDRSASVSLGLVLHRDLVQLKVLELLSAEEHILHDVEMSASARSW